MNLMSLVLVLVALALVGSILLQPRGTGLGRAWGGSGGNYRSKRGMEQMLFWVTVFLAVVFAGLSLINVLN